MRVLLVDDDTRLTHALGRGLRREGHAVDVAPDASEGAWLADENSYDVLVLDVMLPGTPGDVLCARRREQGDWTPILMLTARVGSTEEARALDSGADDFLAKPFSLLVLQARLRALARRGGRARPTVLHVGDLALDPARRVVRRGEQVVDLTPRQFALLDFLMRHVDEVVSKSEILAGVWDHSFEGDPNIVEVYVRRLRSRIDEPFARHTIHTVRGAGYRLSDQAHEKS